jgi:hypothetical protein
LADWCVVWDAGEDAGLFRDRRGNFHIFFHGGNYEPCAATTCNYTGPSCRRFHKGEWNDFCYFHTAWSADGLEWFMDKTQNVFNWTIETVGGHVTYADRARHQVLLNAQGELSHVFGGVRRDDETDFTLTAVQPCHTKATLQSQAQDNAAAKSIERNESDIRPSLAVAQNNSNGANVIVPPTSLLPHEIFVAPSARGNDETGTGSFEAPFATAHKAISVAEQYQTRCVITFRSGVYELHSTLQIAGATFNGLRLQTFKGDLDAGMPPALLSGGRRLPDRAPDADGVYRADLSALGVRATDPADRIFTLFVNGERRQRIRSKLMHWNHSISQHDPCRSCPMNRYGFVFGTHTFDPSWDLTPSATASWLLVSFHQWATGVHTINKIFTKNRTLFVNEPVYSKYAFDNNAAGAQRFYIENAQELPLLEGQFRVLPNKTLEYRLRQNEKLGKAARYHSSMQMVVPDLKWLIKVNGSSDVSLESITLAHSEWELQSKVQGSWRDDVMNMPTSPKTLVGGSGPLPVESQMIYVWKSDRFQMNNCTIRNGGANAFYAAHSKDVAITHSSWFDFGAAAIQSAVTDGIVVSDCRIGRPGQLWQQGLGVGFGHCTNGTVTRCELYEHPSDGVSFSGVGLVHSNTLSHSILHNFGQAGVASRRANESISDWGGVHTAHPNVTGIASHVFANVFANFSSFTIGGYSLYFDYGSSGANASQNVAFNTGSGLFFNSNGECDGWPGSWQVLTDNIFVYNHWTPQDFNILVKWRTLAPRGESRRNIFYVTKKANESGDFQLFHDHTGTKKQQWDGMTWDDNVYYFEGDTSPRCFANSWPYFGNLSLWQSRGKDTHSLVGVDPQFVDMSHDDFRLDRQSRALALGFQEWNHSQVGPLCVSADGTPLQSVVCN